MIASLGHYAARLLLAGASGFLCYGSFEPGGHWFFAIIGMALLWLAFVPWGSNSRPSIGGGMLIALTQSLVMYLLLLPWIGELVGTFPYVALAITESLYALVFGALATVVARRPFLSVWGFALLWIAAEWARSVWPFGGFAWGRLAWGQVSGPVKYLAPLAGPTVVSFAVALIGAGLAAVLFVRSSRALLNAIAALFLPLILAIVSVGVNAATLDKPENPNTVTIAAIQGNVPRLGLDSHAQRKAVLDNHIHETMAIDQPVDVIIWPENSSDINPEANLEAKAEITAAALSANAPVLVGTVTRDDQGYYNTMLVIDPLTGIGERHNKKYLQPFGEWMPFRDLLRHVTEMVDLANDFSPGTGNGMVHMRIRSGEMLPIGVATCYEVIFDKAIHNAVTAGAEVLTVPTNNATFGFSDMTYQQLAMSQLRAIETDRYVVVAATSGVSAIVDNRGKILERTRIFTPAHLVEDIPRRTTITTAVRYGHAIELLLVLLALASFGYAGWREEIFSRKARAARKSKKSPARKSRKANTTQGKRTRRQR